MPRISRVFVFVNSGQIISRAALRLPYVSAGNRRHDHQLIAVFNRRIFAVAMTNVFVATYTLTKLRSAPLSL
jgi:hypothetical protein